MGWDARSQLCICMYMYIYIYFLFFYSAANSEFWKNIPILSLYPTILHFPHKSDCFQSELWDKNLMIKNNCDFYPVAGMQVLIVHLAL